MTGDRRPLLYVLLGSALLVTLLLHLVFLPRYLPGDVLLTVLTVGAGWLTYVLVFYGLGRVWPAPDRQSFPNMRFADVGLALLLVSLLLLLALDAVGIPLEGVVGVYALPVAGIYAGLALLGWSVGRRTEAINEMVR
ncbi:hypothetical protein [Natrinema salaciae]|uniref:Uncharacterized protein n=1 Tax=Natrinema salaciae TaxID=1186196 RepID=A0A1H9LS26_9EURY|nr:hypothetical protein [Natrinema salaciae]SER14312.1 hypothetical protein SAMN04489841_3068 [Natrinema salaciae]